MQQNRINLLILQRKYIHVYSCVHMDTHEYTWDIKQELKLKLNNNKMP